MELDDLRRQWRQANEPPPPLPDPRRLASQRPDDLIGRMRRNAWFELVASFLFAGLPLLVLRERGFRLLYAGVMLGLLTVLAVHYARQLRLLARMRQPDGSLRGHLQQLCAGLRQLLRFYYYLTLWTGPVSLVLVLGYYLAHEWLRPAGPRWLMLGTVAALVLVLGLIFQFGLIYFTRWYLQRLYGRHLDRLEGQLRELDDASDNG